MEKKPFIGQFSGFLYIGEEKAEFDGEMLVSYYAKPYCSKAPEDIENCIEFYNNKLIIRDVKSPDGDQYDCIWEQEDIESVLDKLGRVASYSIDKLKCKTISQLVVPSDCMGITVNAFVDCLRLKKLIFLGVQPELSDSIGIDVINAERYLDEQQYAYETKSVLYTSADIPLDILAEVKQHKEIYDYKVRTLVNPTIIPDVVVCIKDYTAYDRYIISDDVESISADAITWGKWLMFPFKDLILEEKAIAKELTIYAISGGSIEDYAHKNGNQFIALDADIPADSLPYIREGNHMVFRRRIMFDVIGLKDAQIRIILGKKLIPVYGDADNSVRIGFVTADTQQFAGVMPIQKSYYISFLVQKGYIRLENCIYADAHTVMCDFVWSEQYTPEYDRWIYIRSLFKDKSEIFLIQEIVTSAKEIQVKSSAFDVFLSETEGESENICDFFRELFVPGCSLSKTFFKNVHLKKNQLSALSYGVENCYQNDPYGSNIIFRVKNGDIYAAIDDGKEEILTGINREFAEFYINHYRQCYYLPPIVLKEK